MRGIGLLSALAPILRGQTGELKRHAGTQVILAVAIGVLSALAFVFLVALGVLLLSDRIGLPMALATGFGVSVAVILILALLMRIEAETHRRRQAEAAARDKRLLTEAALAAVGGLGAKSAIAATLAALVVGIVAGQGGDRDEGT